MKKATFILFLTALVLCFTDATVYAQKFSGMDKSPHDISYYPNRARPAAKIRVIYGRPQKKGREIFGKLEAYGKVWRTGANEATEIKFYQDVKMGGKTVKAGSYSLFTIPNEKNWTIIISTQVDVWGAYNYDESKDVARIEVPVQSTESVVEAFSIAFKEVDTGAHMIMAWDKTMVAVPFEL